MITDLSSVKSPQLVFVLNNITLLTQSLADNKIDFETYTNLVCNLCAINMKHSDRVDLVLIGEIFDYVINQLNEKLKQEKTKTKSTTEILAIEQKYNQIKSELLSKRDNFRLKFALSRLKIVEGTIREYSSKLLWEEIFSYLGKFIPRKDVELVLEQIENKLGEKHAQSES